jgi:hypothetical protein
MSEGKQIVALSDISGFDSIDDDDDRGFEGIIRGAKVRFSKDYKFVVNKTDSMPPGEYIGLKVVKAVQDWTTPNKPLTRILQPKEKLPDLEKMNRDAVKAKPSLKRTKFGKTTGPFDWTYAFYIVHVQTRRPFTFLTNSKGGCAALRELKQNWETGKAIGGQNALPVFELATADWPYYGNQRRPCFDVKYYRGGKPALEEAEAPQQITHEPDEGDNDEPCVTNKRGVQYLRKPKPQRVDKADFDDPLDDLE